MADEELSISDATLIARWDDYVESMGSVMGEVEHMAQQMRDRIEVLVKVRPPYDFDRYINGIKMAEGVTIERQTDIESACREAARIASKGPDGEVPVLVLAVLH